MCSCMFTSTYVSTTEVFLRYHPCFLFEQGSGVSHCPRTLQIGSWLASPRDLSAPPPQCWATSIHHQTAFFGYSSRGRLNPLASKANIFPFQPPPQSLSPFNELFLGYFILYFLCRNYRVCLKWEGVLHGIVLTYHWGGWRPEEMGSYSVLEATLAARQPPAPQSWGQILTQRQMVPSIRLCFCLSRRNMTLTISTCQSLLEGTLTTQPNFYPNCHIVLGSTLWTLRTFFKLGV